MRFCRRYLAVLLALATLAGCGTKGIVRTPAKLTDIKNPAVEPHQLWSSDVGNGSGGQWSSLRVTVAEDAVYAAAEDGRVYAFKRDNGDTIWRTDTDTRVISGPTVAGDQVLVGTLDAQVVALKRADGKLLWKGDAPSEVMAPPVSDGRVVVVRAVDGRIFGLSADTGKRAWSFERSEPDLTLRGLSKPLLFDSRVLIGTDNGKIVSLTADDGQPNWEQTLSTPSGRSDLDRLTDVDADPLAGPLGVYVVSYGGDIGLMDPDSGEFRWKRRIKSYSGMALGDNLLFVTDDDGYVWALDPATGAQAWKQEALKYRDLSPPAFFDGYVVVGDFEGYLHWLRPADGAIVGRTRLDSDPIITAPAAAGKRLYVMDADGDLAAFEDRKPDH
ncbi:MAG: outer membrane protein assembly factor BamB [Gammaproteobacteria bacterium]|nr:outer membrane protein assembly factor BamB [Gammaproteobacteria bacterium]